MSGNFWQSSHYQQWLLEREEINIERQHDLKYLSVDEYQKLQIFFCHFIQTLGEQLKLRQQVIATATIYFKRFYARNSLKSIDPLLLMPTTLFLASKVEEQGTIQNAKLLNACSSVLKNKFSFALPSDYPYRINQILECEFYLMEMLDCCLVVFHPYRSLTKYVADMGQEESLLPMAWRVVNDCLRTDVCVIYPPYMVALASIYMTCVVSQKDCKQWFSELTVDMKIILSITQDILTLYENWKTFDEKKEIPILLQKMPKPKSSMSSRPSSTNPHQHTASPLAANIH